MSILDFIHVIAGYQEAICIQVLEYEVWGESHKTPGQIDSKIGEYSRLYPYHSRVPGRYLDTGAGVPGIGSI